MKKVLLVCAVINMLTACGPTPQTKTLTYQNIVILSDMSSRINNRPLKDVTEIRKIVEHFKSECVKPGEKIGDKSSISFSVFSEKVAASIDLSRFKKIGEKQQFINSTGKYENTGLAKEIENFENTVEQVYGRTQNKGLDLISILIEKVENEPIVKMNTYVTDGVDTTYINYDNHIYVFTDGYLEYKSKQTNREFYFGIAEIEKVRRYCRENDVDVEKALANNRSLCLPLIKSPKNKHLNIHVLETHERDFDTHSQTYKYPKGLRDNEILERVWRQWATESGFKSFEWRKY